MSLVNVLSRYLVLSIPLALVACSGDEPVGPPGNQGPGELALTFDFGTLPVVTVSAGLLRAEGARVTIVPPSGPSRDTVVAIGSSGGVFGGRVRLGPGEAGSPLRVRVAVVSGGHEYFRGEPTGPVDSKATGTVSVPMGLVVGRIAVVPDTVEMSALGDSAVLSATGEFTDGATIPDLDFTWLSADPTVVEVDADGIAVARANGETLVQARRELASGVVWVRVRQEPFAVTSVVPATLDLVVGATARLAAYGTDRRGHDVADSLDVVWSADVYTPVAGVSSRGLVLGMREGTGVVTASLPGGSASAQVGVRAGPGAEARPIVATDGPHFMRMNLSGQADTFATMPNSGVKTLRWDPAHQRLVFPTIGSLFTIQLDGRVTEIPVAGVRRPEYPGFSEDGAWVYFHARDSLDKVNVYRVRPVGGRPELVAGSPSYTRDEVAWATPAPDGNGVLYVYSRPAYYAFWRIYADGTRRMIEDADFPLRSPAFSPDAEWLAFLLYDSQALALMPAEGGRIRLVEGSGFRPGLSWSPDGNWIIGFTTPPPRASFVHVPTLEVIHVYWPAGAAAWWR